MKAHLRITIETLLAKGVSQHEIARRTGVDRKTIRRYQSNSPMATRQGRVVYQYKQPFRDGSTHVVLEPLPT